MTTFPAHGIFEINIESDIVIIEAQGPWNYEYFDLLHNKLATVLGEFSGKNFGILISLIGDALSTKRGLDYHLQHVLNSNVSIIAINFEQCTTDNVTKYLMSDLYTKANIHHEFFSTTL